MPKNGSGLDDGTSTYYSGAYDNGGNKKANELKQEENAVVHQSVVEVSYTPGSMIKMVVVVEGHERKLKKEIAVLMKRRRQEEGRHQLDGRVFLIFTQKEHRATVMASKKKSGCDVGINPFRRVQAQTTVGMISCARVEQSVIFLMENHQVPKKDYLHYNHTDSCNYNRWTARPWQKVVEFYSQLVNGNKLLSGLFPTETHSIHDDADIVETCDKPEPMGIPTKDRSGRWARITFKILLSYHGDSFDGWQKQPGLKTVQGLIESSLGKFIDEKKAELLKDKGLPLEGCAVVAGRTDKGVTAISQVSRAFHPNFSAKWRRYLYIFPLKYGEEGEQSSQSEIYVEDVDYKVKEGDQTNEFDTHVGNGNFVVGTAKDEVESGKKSTRFKVSKVNQLLRRLEGRLLSYKMFARDTKASRNIGPPTECYVFHARATETALPCDEEDGEYAKVMCIELVANRFLRKMVRVLVATSIREAAAGAEDDALIKLMDATCRRATAPPAPPDGLCLVDVGYTEFDPLICLIH
ncbi:hypothetical protein RJ639_013472 [Escallonia herrerae]|uniref:Pseudouridine synthase I TruA alpha/beta domain-containing protein n=1 Tax=Escallonia herrerae TaxID=1293975 RepID=A0AA89AP24_9ASTE|nr:hypothetical protein RJ639_013472 [Escallonia herrerae]